MNINLIVGARPNMMKAAPLYHELIKRNGGEVKVVHTGQHNTEYMSDVFLRQLELPIHVRFSGSVGGSHGETTAYALRQIELAFIKERPDLVVVFGDVNSTLAAAISAKKLGMPVVHVEAGLRSFDSSMPEEINRIIVDSVSDLHLVTEPSGIQNLAKEGKEGVLVGNLMIDSLYKLSDSLQEPKHLTHYALITMHRPSNVDSSVAIKDLVDLLESISAKIDAFFPVHPRTMKSIMDHGALNKLAGNRLHILPPQSYADFITMLKWATVVITDSGGVQEESTALRVPCLTVRDNTERPITVDVGSNTLIGSVGRCDVGKHIDSVLCGEYKKGVIPELWDGHASIRAVDAIMHKFRG